MIEPGVDVVACPLHISIIDGMRPRVRNLRSNAVRHAFVQLDSKTVVPGIAAVLDLQDRAIASVDSIRKNPNRCGKRAGLVSIGIPDAIRNGGARRTEI